MERLACSWCCEWQALVAILGQLIGGGAGAPLDGEEEEAPGFE